METTTETVKPKHSVGDPIHVKLFYADDRAMFVHYGIVAGVQPHAGTYPFRDTILYDVFLEQTDGPQIRICNLREGFVMAGGPELYDNEAEGKPSEPHKNSDQIDLEKIVINGTGYLKQLD